VRRLCPPDGDLCAVGDPDQAINGFRGADVGFFLRFREDYPTARTVHLTRNYRSSPTIVFGALTTGVGLADDLHTGLIDRFRSLPMARSAVLVGRTGADLVRNFFVILLMCVVGVIVGWTVETDAWGLVGAILIILAFAYSLSWVFAIVGLSVRDAETAQAVSFPILAPLVFASSAFVPVATMPSWLQGWAKNQPVSVVVDAARALTLGNTPLTHASSVPKALVWVAAIVKLPDVVAENSAPMWRRLPISLTRS
jgi:ABC transporter DrrB family efflux protein